MAWWTKRFNELSATATPDPVIVEDSDSLYVDDYNFLFYILAPGTKLSAEDNQMRIVEDKVEIDQEIPEDVRSMREIIKMANSICPILQFTGDCPGAEEGRTAEMSSRTQTDTERQG